MLFFVQVSPCTTISLDNYLLGQLFLKDYQKFLWWVVDVLYAEFFHVLPNLVYIKLSWGFGNISRWLCGNNFEAINMISRMKTTNNTALHLL